MPLARLPRFPPKLDRGSATANEIRAGLPVRGASQWEPMSQAVLWLLGTGGTLVSAGPTAYVGPYSAGQLDGYIAAPGDSITHYFYHWPSPSAWNRMWCITLVAPNGLAQASGRLYFSASGEDHPWTIDASSYNDKTKGLVVVRHLEHWNTGTPAQLGVALQNDATSVSPVMFGGITCHELPVNGFTGGEINLAAGAPIHEGRVQIVADKALADSANESCINYARRNCVFSWGVDASAGVTISRTSFVGTSNIFRDSPPVLARHKNLGVNTGTFAVACKTDGVTGTLRVTATSGDSVDIPLAGFAGWHLGEITVDTEDLSRNEIDGGIRGGVRDQLLFEAIRTTGTNVQITGLCVGEAEPF